MQPANSIEAHPQNLDATSNGLVERKEVAQPEPRAQEKIQPQPEAGSEPVAELKAENPTEPERRVEIKYGRDQIDLSFNAVFHQTTADQPE